MIAQSLNLIVRKFDDYLRTLLGAADNQVILARLTNANSTTPPENDNKIILTVVNMERELTISSYASAQPTATALNIVAPPVYINVFVMFSANFADYSTGLNYISETISFFQRNPWFSQANLPGLPTEIDKLSFELQNMATQELSELWSMHGGHYLPAVVYKLRMFPFGGSAMTINDIPPAPNN